MKSSSLTLSRGTLHYRDTGHPDTPGTAPLLLLHGSHGDWRHWARNLPALARHHRVLVPDMPGFGESSSLPGEPQPADLAEALAEFIDTLGLSRLTLVGFSFGCLVTVALARARAERIDRVMLVQPPGIGPVSEAGAEIAATATAVSRSEGRRAGMRETLRRLMLADPAHVDDETLDLALSMAAASRLRTTTMSRGADLLGAVSGLPQRLRVLIGEQDPYHAHDLAGRRERLHQARGADCVTFVPNAAHWLQRDQGPVFEQHLLDFARDR